jgi:hypothetical protein
MFPIMYIPQATGIAPSSVAIASGYFATTAAADAIAASMVSLVAYPTATATAKAEALLRASWDVDRAERWQGRMFVFDQPNEFPRAAYDSSRRSLVGYGPVGPAGFGIGDTVWDWDYDTETAVVPPAVYKAVIYQADSILQGVRDERLDAQHDGISAQSIGSSREEYVRRTASEEMVLCRRAWDLMKRYTLASGRMM